jgi:hypothetical protein
LLAENFPGPPLDQVALPLGVGEPVTVAVQAVLVPTTVDAGLQVTFTGGGQGLAYVVLVVVVAFIVVMVVVTVGDTVVVVVVVEVMMTGCAIGMVMQVVLVTVVEFVMVLVVVVTHGTGIEV